MQSGDEGRERASVLAPAGEDERDHERGIDDEHDADADE
jgi:hypothetical protein